jgi:hypothetical protein
MQHSNVQEAGWKGMRDSKISKKAALRPSRLIADWTRSTMFFIMNRFIYPEPDFPDQSQDLAPFLPGRGLEEGC